MRGPRIFVNFRIVPAVRCSVARRRGISIALGENKMQFRMKLAAIAASGGVAALMLVGPAVASVPAGSPAWTTGREVVHGQLHGKAAWIQATRSNPRIPVKFRGVVRTHGIVSLGNASSTTHSIRTRVGRFT